MWMALLCRDRIFRQAARRPYPRRPSRPPSRADSRVDAYPFLLPRRRQECRQHGGTASADRRRCFLSAMLRALGDDDAVREVLVFLGGGERAGIAVGA